MADPMARSQTRGWGPTALLIGGLAVVGLALLIVPGWIVPAPTPAPGPASGSPHASVSFPPSAYRSIDWQVAGLGAGSDGASVLGFTLAGERLVAIGSRDFEPLAWWSDDGGSTWTAAPSMTAPAPAPVEGAVALPLSLAASGSRVAVAGVWLDPKTRGSLGPMVWVSPDGSSWQAYDLSATMPDVVLGSLTGTADGFYAAGWLSASGAPGWWQSFEGIVWGPVDVTGLVGLSMTPPAVLWTPDLILAASGSGGPASARPAVWAADQGLEFAQVFTDQETWGSIRALAQADYGFVAAGQVQDNPGDTATGHLAVWISATGRDWQRLAVDTPVGTRATAVAANTAGALVIGTSTAAQTAEAWFLPGGAGVPSVVRLPFGARSVVALPDRFVVLGVCPPEDACTGPMVAIGRPSQAAEAPTPTLPPR